MKQVLSLCFIQLCDFINGGAIYPYIVFLVQSFSVTNDERKLGYYAGLLASSYFFAQLLSSLLWGIASDKFGRRPCLLLGLFFSAVTVVIFGFSSSLTAAIVTRFLSGFLNGNVGITKTMLGEISTSETQARAFSYFGFTVAVSGIVGPMVGGVLSKPSTKYPNTFGGIWLFETYPYCLPNLIVGSLSMVGLVAGYFLLPETKKWSETEKPITCNWIGMLFSKSSDRKFTKLQELTTIIPSTSVTLGDESEGRITIMSDDESDAQPPADVVVTHETTMSIAQRLDVLRRDRGVVISCALYSILGFVFVFYEEMTPYWAFLDVENGGLGFSSTDIGIMLSIGCIIGMLFQMLVYPRIANKWGILKSFQIGGIFTLPGFLLLPYTSLLSLLLTSNKHLQTNALAWILLMIAILFIQVGAELQFVSIMISISNSAVPELMGTVNGLAQTFVALTRAVAPVVGSSLLSWSLTNGLPFPFTYQFPFFVLVILAIIILLISMRAPTSLNIQKKLAMQKEAEKLLQSDM